MITIIEKSQVKLFNMTIGEHGKIALFAEASMPHGRLSWNKLKALYIEQFPYTVDWLVQFCHFQMTLEQGYCYALLCGGIACRLAGVEQFADNVTEHNFKEALRAVWLADDASDGKNKTFAYLADVFTNITELKRITSRKDRYNLLDAILSNTISVCFSGASHKVEQTGQLTMDSIDFLNNVMMEQIANAERCLGWSL